MSNGIIITDFKGDNGKSFFGYIKDNSNVITTQSHTVK